MKRRSLLLISAMLAGALASGSAMAQRHGHARVGIYFGAPLFGASFGSPFYDPFYTPYYGPRYYPQPYYYPAPVVVAPAPAPVYIEQSSAQAAPQQLSPNYWYYCQDPQGYYPYVRNCNVNWQQVAPAPQP